MDDVVAWRRHCQGIQLRPEHAVPLQPEKCPSGFDVGGNTKHLSYVCQPAVWPALHRTSSAGEQAALCNVN